MNSANPNKEFDIKLDRIMLSPLMEYGFSDC